MKTILSFFIILTTGNLFCQTLSWSKLSSSQIRNFKVASDQNGNVITSGWFTGTLDFDPGPAVYNLSSVRACAFVTKLDASGNFLWAVSLNEIVQGSSNGSYDITTDAAGNIFLAGFFAGTVDFDPGPGVVSVTSYTTTLNPFIWKLSANGGLVWVKQMPADFMLSSLATDPSGSLLVSGRFKGTCDMDWGTATTTVTALGTMDGFFSKLDAIGNLVYFKQFGYPGSYSTLSSVSLDAYSNLQIVGNFSNTIDVDPGSGTHLLNGPGYQFFTANLNPVGNFISGLSILPPVGSTTMTSVSRDLVGNIYVAGRAAGVCDFDPSPSVYTLQVTDGIFACKLNPLGNFSWAKVIPSSAPIPQTIVIKTDGQSNVYLKGTMSNGSFDADPGPGVFLLSTVFNDNFVCIFSPSADFITAFKFFGQGEMEIDPFGTIYFTGYNFDPNSFTSKYTSLVTGTRENQQNELGLTLFPNPSNGLLTLKNAVDFGKGSFEIYNASGQKIIEQVIDSESTSVNLQGQAPGLYLLRVRAGENKSFEKKIIIQ